MKAVASKSVRVGTMRRMLEKLNIMDWVDTRELGLLQGVV
jgi:hypothetical protein